MQLRGCSGFGGKLEKEKHLSPLIRLGLGDFHKCYGFSSEAGMGVLGGAANRALVPEQLSPRADDWLRVVGLQLERVLLENPGCRRADVRQLGKVLVVWESQQTGERATASALLLTHQELHLPLFQGLLAQPFPFSRRTKVI